MVHIAPGEIISVLVPLPPTHSIILRLISFTGRTYDDSGIQQDQSISIYLAILGHFRFLFQSLIAKSPLSKIVYIEVTGLIFVVILF